MFSSLSTYPVHLLGIEELSLFLCHILHVALGQGIKNSVFCVIVRTSKCGCTKAYHYYSSVVRGTPGLSM